MAIGVDEAVKLIDVAKHVADMFAGQPYSGENIEAMKKERTDGRRFSTGHTEPPKQQ